MMLYVFYSYGPCVGPARTPRARSARAGVTWRDPRPRTSERSRSNRRTMLSRLVHILAQTQNQPETQVFDLGKRAVGGGKPESLCSRASKSNSLDYETLRVRDRADSVRKSTARAARARAPLLRCRSPLRAQRKTSCVPHSRDIVAIETPYLSAMSRYPSP